MLLPYLLPPPLPTDPPPSRWSLEVGALHQRYPQSETLWTRGRQSVYAVLPATLRLAVRLNDGSHLYLGLQYGQRRGSVTALKRYPDLPRYSYWQTTRAVTTWAVPVGAGIALFPKYLAATPWRTEVLFGITFLTARYRIQEYSTAAGSTSDVTQGDEPGIAADIPLSFGARIGYRLGKHLEINTRGEACFSGLVMLNQAFGGDSSPFGGSASAGLTYHF